MAENTATSDKGDEPTGLAKTAPVHKGDTVENTILITTPSHVVRRQHDEQAREEFDALYKGKKLDNVECVAKTHNVGHGIEYTFRADVK